MRNLKKILALVLALMMVLSVMVFASAANYDDYSDKDQVSPEYAEAVEVLTGMDIFWGSENSFYPKSNVSRAEVATLLYRVMTTDVSGSQVGIYADYGMFDDVLETNWFAGYVNYSANNEYVVGVGDNNYNPNGNVTGYEWITMLLRAIGYDQNNEISGSDWKITAAGLAQEAGILDGFNETTLNSALTREEVAHLLFNAIQARKVSYTPALGYQPSRLGYTIAWDMFRLMRSGELNVDHWGRPGYVWYEETANGANPSNANYNELVDPVYGTIEYTPVQTYTTAERDCDIATDLGITRSTSYQLYVDGNRSTPTLNPLATTYSASGNGTGTGTQTEVYQLADGTYRLVEINTYFAQVTAVQPQVTDPAGHVAVEASITMNVYSSVSPWTGRTYETTGYSVGDYVKVTMLSDGTVMSVEAATPAATGVVSSYQTQVHKYTGNTVTVGNTPYTGNVKFCLNNVPTVGQTYNVYTDEYGNVLALVVPTSLTSYAILDSGVEVTSGFNPHYLGKLVTVANGAATLSEQRIASYTNGANADLLAIWSDDKVTPENNIVSYVVTANGYALKDAADTWGDNGTVTQGEPRIYDDSTVVAATDAGTVYVVETAEGVFTAYTGYTSVPSISSISWFEVLDSDNDGYADLVYINAIGAVYAGSTTFAFVMPSTADVGDGSVNGVAYDVYNHVVINGQVTDVNVAKSFSTFASRLAGFAVNLVYDANGLVVGGDPITFTGTTNVYSSSGNVIHFNSAPSMGFVVTDSTVIWTVDTTNNRAAVSDVSDLVAGTSVHYLVAADGVTLSAVMIWDTLPWG